MILNRTILLCVALFSASASQATPVHRYTVSIDAQLQTLDVRACFDGAPPRALTAASYYAADFLNAGRGLTAEPSGSRYLSLADVPPDDCVEYQVDVEAAAALDRRGSALYSGSDLVVSPRLWLWRPVDSDADIELQFDLPQGTSVSAPWRPLGKNRFSIGGRPAYWPAAVAFGRFQERRIEVPGAVLGMAVLDGDPPPDVDAIEQWLTDAAHSVANLYGRFPVEHMQLLVFPQGDGREAVPFARVVRGGGAAVQFFINQRHPLRAFHADWTATHEFSHLLHPYVRRDDAWLSEGLASYYQNVLRARNGRLTEQQAWQKLHEGFGRGRRGTDGATLADVTENMYRDRAYMRVYWSGAAIALLADLRLRKLSGGEQSLGSALAGLAECCLPSDRAWSARELMVRLDALTGTEVFRELYREHAKSGEFPDLTEAYRDLGLGVEAGEIDRWPASYAHLREAIMQGD